MPQVYLNGDQISEIEQALRDGVSMERIATHYGCTPEELVRLLGRPSWKQIPTDSQVDTVDLWAGEDLL